MPPIYRNGSIALRDRLVVNGQSILPTFRYAGDQALAGTWRAATGVDLSLVSSPAPGYLQASSPLGSTDLAVSFGGAAGSALRAGSTSDYSLSTEDGLFVAVAQIAAGGSGTRAIFAKMAFSSGNDQGYGLWIDGSLQPNFRWSTTGNVGSTVVGAALSTATWYLLMACVDPSEASSNGQALFVNGQLVGTATPTSQSIANSAQVHVGLQVGGSGVGPYNGHVSHVIGWAASGLWPGGADNLILWRELARELFDRWLNGVPA